MSKEREVLKLARDVLLPYKSTGLRRYTDVDEALDAIEEVLAQREHSCVACEGNPKGNNNPCSVCGTTQPEQEPVATLDDLEQEIYENTRQFVSRDVMEWMLKRYYTTPPKRTWIGLTDEDIKAVNAQVSQIPPIDYTTTTYARAIETKLKQKNGFAEEENT